jgi:hypothetical protein
LLAASQIGAPRGLQAERMIAKFDQLQVLVEYAARNR